MWIMKSPLFAGHSRYFLHSARFALPSLSGPVLEDELAALPSASERDPCGCWRGHVECQLAPGLWTLDSKLQTSLTAIQRAAHAQARLAHHVAIDLRGGHVVMAQQTPRFCTWSRRSRSRRAASFSSNCSGSTVTRSLSPSVPSATTGAAPGSSPPAAVPTAFDPGPPSPGAELPSASRPAGSDGNGKAS